MLDILLVHAILVHFTCFFITMSIHNVYDLQNPFFTLQTMFKSLNFEMSSIKLAKIQFSA